MLQRFLILWLVALCSLAFKWPAIQALLPWLPDPFAGTSPGTVTLLITGTMFAIGLMLPRNEVDEVVRRWRAILFGTGLQYTCMPLLAYALGRLFHVTGDDLIGVVLVGCVPGAMASNVITLNARGHASYSMSLTTSATLLSPLAVPLLLRLLLPTAQRAHISLAATSLNLLLTVVLPVAIGHAVSRRFPRLESVVNRTGAALANLAILWIIASVVGKWRDQFAALRIDLFSILLGINLLGYLAGYIGGWFARLPESMRRALTIEIGMQNAGLGVKLAGDLFPDQAVAVAPAMYTFGCMLTGTLLAGIWAARRTDRYTAVTS